jgi:hypothetical protein
MLIGSWNNNLGGSLLSLFSVSVYDLFVCVMFCFYLICTYIFFTFSICSVCQVKGQMEDGMERFRRLA